MAFSTARRAWVSRLSSGGRGRTLGGRLAELVEGDLVEIVDDGLETIREIVVRGRRVTAPRRRGPWGA